MMTSNKINYRSNVIANQCLGNTNKKNVTKLIDFIVFNLNLNSRRFVHFIEAMATGWTISTQPGLDVS